METIRIQNGQTERIEVIATNILGIPLTGLTDVLLAIRRISDGKWLDFNDNTFKSSGWTTRQQTMTEINATYDAGKYYYDFNTTGFSDDTYELRCECASAGNMPQIGELKVGGYVDNIDATISSRSTLGAGVITWTYTITENITDLPISDVDVWITTDSAGANIIASGKTNSNGVVTFYLDAGTVYVWCQKSGYNFSNPDVEIVS